MNYLQNDLYKITMAQVVWQKFANAEARYHYTLRTKDVDLRPFIPVIKNKVDAMDGVGPKQSEIGFLREHGFFSEPFLESLRHFRLNTNFIHIGEKDGNLDIEIVGPWYDTIWFEVPVLQAVSEAYFEEYSRHHRDVWKEGRKRLDEKIDLLLRAHEEWETAFENAPQRPPNPYRLMEFGTRRAFSREWQAEVVHRLSYLPKDLFVGSSNMHLSMKNNLMSQGTMAHEYICAHLAFYPPQEAQRQAFYNWNDVYRGKLGTALSDTFTFDQFLRDFGLDLASLFTGARHDSGDPYLWADKLVAHYKSIGIDPYNKVAVWSDNLDIPKSLDLWRKNRDRIKCGFGIGTNLTNDLGPKALSQVIKLTHMNGMPLVKISDEPEKVMCEDLAYRDWIVHLFTEVLAKK